MKIPLNLNEKDLFKSNMEILDILYMINSADKNLLEPYYVIKFLQEYIDILNENDYLSLSFYFFIKGLFIQGKISFQLARKFLKNGYRFNEQRKKDTIIFLEKEKNIIIKERRLTEDGFAIP